MRTGNFAGKHRIYLTPGLKKRFVQARRLVIALGALVISAASAQGQAPVFIQNFVSNDAGPAGIQVVTCMENGVAVQQAV